MLFLSWFNRTLQSAIPSKVFYTSLYSGLQSTKIHRDGLRLWSRDTLSFRDELRLWSRDILFRDELKLGSRVTLSLNLTVYAKILHYCSITNKDKQHRSAFYWQAPSDYIYKSAANISTTFLLDKKQHAFVSKFCVLICK